MLRPPRQFLTVVLVLLIGTTTASTPQAQTARAVAVSATTPATPAATPATPAATSTTPAATSTTPATTPATPATTPTTPATTPATPAAPEVAVIAATRLENPKIVIDGRVDEAVWFTVPAYDNMRVVEPDTLVPPTYATASRFIGTSKGLYVSAVMEQAPDTLVARLSSRDQFLNRDGYGITLDTSGQGLYGYWFTVNLGGSLGDGKVAAERSFSRQWDGPWRGASSITEDGWSVEMFLPWSMMTMPHSNSDRTMGLWVNRKVAHMDERYSWPALPFTSARFMSALKPLALAEVSPAKQWSVFPYTSMAMDAVHSENSIKVGVDMSWRPSSNVQLMTALNPDFGAVDSDDVVVNLTAVETYFPEKRLFFLEGSEVFVTSPRANVSSGGPQGQGARRSPSSFGREPTTLLNTRRIGGAPRHVDIPDELEVAGVEQSKPTDLLGTAKLIGQSGNMRYGLLGAFEDDVELRASLDGVDTVYRADGRNFGAARVLFETSTDGGRRSIGYLGTLVDKINDTAVVHGIDTHWLGNNGKIQWDTQFITSLEDDVRGYGVFTDIGYTPKKGTFHRFAFEYLDDKLEISDFGFIRRTDAISAVWGIFRNYSGDSLPDWLRNFHTSMFASAERNTGGQLTRAGLFSGARFTFLNNSQLRLHLNYFPQRWDDLNSLDNGAFRITDRTFAQVQYGTDSSKPLSVSLSVGRDGESLGGSRLLLDTGFTFAPLHSFSLDFDVRYQDRDGWLVHREDGEFTTYKAEDLQPRLAVDLFLNARQHLRLTAQWAGIKGRAQRFYVVPEDDGALISRPAPEDGDDLAISRLTIQLRYRWEIGPLSDLFVVYTRGGNPEDRVDETFGELFADAFDEPIVDLFLVKLRYRFGS